MNNSQISPNNKLQEILDFDKCKELVAKAIANNESCVILAPHYSINIAAKYLDGESLQFDLDELGQYLGQFVQVSDYDDLVIYLDSDSEME